MWLETYFNKNQLSNLITLCKCLFVATVSKERAVFIATLLVYYSKFENIVSSN